MALRVKFNDTTLREWDDALFWAALVAALLLCLVPLWSVDIVPLQDWPGHLATARVLRDMADPASPYHAMYFRPAWPLPNAIFFYATAWLGHLMPIDVAGKVVLTASLVALPVAAAWLMRALGLSRWLGLASCWFVYNDMVGYGFAAFVTGMPLLLVAAGLLWRQATEPSRGRGVRLAGVFALLFFFHAQVFLMGGLLAVVLAALCLSSGVPDRRRRLVGIALPVTVGSVPFLAWFLRFFAFPPRRELAEITFGGLRTGPGFRWASASQLLDELRHGLVLGLHGHADEVAVLCIAGTLLVLLWRRRAPALPDAPGALRWVVEAWTTVLFLGFVFLPLHMRGQALISSRLLLPAVLLMMAWGRPPRALWGRVLLALGILAGTGWYEAHLAQAFARYDREELGAFRQLLAALGPADRLAYLRPDRAHRIVERGASWYLDSYHMVFNGGIARMPFHVIYPHHTVVRPGFEPPRVPERSPAQFLRSRAARWYTHVLVYSKRKPSFGPGAKTLELLGHTGHLWLYALPWARSPGGPPARNAGLPPTGRPGPIRRP